MKMVKIMAEQYAGVTILATPVTKSKKRSINSFCVDLCLARFSTKKNKYYFTFLDIKTGSQPNHSEKNKDAKEFKRQLGLSLKSLQIQYEV